jgi:hypothetical protein
MSHLQQLVNSIDEETKKLAEDIRIATIRYKGRLAYLEKIIEESGCHPEFKDF